MPQVVLKGRYSLYSCVDAAMSNTYVLRDEKCDGHRVRVETLGLWDVFVMQKVGGEGEIRFGDQVALRTRTGATM